MRYFIAASGTTSKLEQRITCTLLLSMIPKATIIPPETKMIQMKTVKFSEDKIVAVVCINEEFGTIIKGYAYFPPTIEGLKKYAPGFEEAYDSGIYKSNFLIFMNDLPYATERMIFNSDFESLFDDKTCCIPDAMYDKTISDIDDFAKKLSFHRIYNRL